MKKISETRGLPELVNVPAFVLPDLAKWTVEESLVFSDIESPFHGKFIEGDSRLLLIVGENASGKSLAFRLISQLLGENTIEAMTLSVRERTGGGTFEMGRMRQAMIYGREEVNSTGATSVRVVETGFRNLHTREIPSVLALDEPEIGLSGSYSRALGTYIGQEAAKQKGNACGVMVVTHSPGLVEGLVQGLGATPSFMSVAPRTDELAYGVEDWLDSGNEKTIEDLKALGKVSHERYLAMQAVLNGAHEK